MSEYSSEYKNISSKEKFNTIFLFLNSPLEYLYIQDFFRKNMKHTKHEKHARYTKGGSA